MNLAKVKLKTLLIFPPRAKEKDQEERNIKIDNKYKNNQQPGIAAIGGYLKLKKYKKISVINLEDNKDFSEINYYTYFDLTEAKSLVLKKKPVDKSDKLYELIKKMIYVYRPNIIGFSVSYIWQYHSALAMSKIIKEIDKKIFIVLGGCFITEQASYGIASFDFCRSYIDALIVYEGEEPMTQLISSLANKKRLDDVPNLFFKKKPEGRFVRSKKHYLISINNLLIPPHIGKLEKDHVCLRMSLGCSWGRCVFCNQKKHFFKHKYQVVDLKKLIELIKKIKQTHKIKKFYFCDQMIDPYCLKKFSKLLIKNNVKILWGCYFLAFSPGFANQELCNLMKKSGFIFATFGFESASARILKLMGKIHTPQIALNILKCFKLAGVKHIFLQIMYNFPGETVQDFKETLTFLKRHKKLYHTIALNKYYLSRDTEVYRHPKKYGIKLIKKNLFFSSRAEYSAPQMNELLEKKENLIKNLDKEIKERILFYSEEKPQSTRGE